MTESVPKPRTPAGELRAAAAKLREMAAATAGGEWTAEYLDNHNVWWVTHETHDGDWVTHGTVAELDSVGMAGNAAWIALLGPDTAELLAVWLETEAHCLGVGDGVGEKTADLLDAIAGEPLKLSVTVVADTSVPALAFARSILGG